MIMGVQGDSEAVESTTLSNTKLKHAYVYKLTRQKVTYLLDKPFSVNCPNDKLLELLEQDYFNATFRQNLISSAKSAITCGKAWIQAYIDDDAHIQFKFVKGTQVRPYWKDEAKTELNAIMKIIKYDVVGAEGKAKDVTQVEFYNLSGVYYFTIQGSNKNGTGGVLKKKPVNEESNFLPYFFYTDIMKKINEAGVEEVVTEEVNGVPVPKRTEPLPGNFGIIPFIPIRYNDDEIPLITFIKDKVDDYDHITSASSDFIKDVPSAIKVVKGYSGKDTKSFVKNLATYRVVFVDQDGSVENLSAAMDTAGLDSHLNRLREDIYSDGSGVDPTRKESLGQTSGVALKYLFQDLDNDVRGLWSSINYALQQIYQFVCIDLEQRKFGMFYDVPVKFIPNTDALINEQEVITNLVNSMSMLSRKTILANHPYVTDVIAEMDEVDKEKKEAMALYQQQGGFQFNENGHPINPPDEDGDDEDEEEK
jgi:SPP1 family phage portal protein